MKELSTVLQIYPFLYQLSKCNCKCLGFGKDCLDLGHCTSKYIMHVFSLGVVMVVLYVSAEYCGRSQNKESLFDEPDSSCQQRNGSQNTKRQR